MAGKSKAQKQKFIDAARELGADVDESVFDERLKDIVDQPPPPGPSSRAKKEKASDK